MIKLISNISLILISFLIVLIKKLTKNFSLTKELTCDLIYMPDIQKYNIIKIIITA